MATAASAMMFSQARSGSLSGLMAAPCTPPDHRALVRRRGRLGGPPDRAGPHQSRRRPGRGRSAVLRSQRHRRGARQPRVDHRRPQLPYGRRCESLVEVEGPLTVAVRASEGRVSAMALDRRSAGARAAGRRLAVQFGRRRRPPWSCPGCPRAPGRGSWSWSTPGPSRAEVGVEVLGIEGAFAPIGAETLVVPPETHRVGRSDPRPGGAVRQHPARPAPGRSPPPSHSVSSVRGRPAGPRRPAGGGAVVAYRGGGAGQRRRRRLRVHA